MSLEELIFVAFAALVTSIGGGVAGYGTGLLMPLVLVPLIGAQAVVPVLGVSAIFNNLSRIAAFRKDIAWGHVWQITLIAMPFCYIGAAFYSELSGPGAAVLIGSALIFLVPMRRVLKSYKRALSQPAIYSAGALFGLVTGGVPGGGVILISLLMSIGVTGGATIATDAVISLIVGLVKIGTFQTYGQLPLSSWALAALIGMAGIPGAFIAKWISDRLSVKVHTGVMDAMVVIGGAVLIARGLKLF
jgi:uncharacterized membrane protein YfcA